MLNRSGLLFVVVACAASSVSGADPKVLTGHADPAYAAVYTPDGTKLVTGSFDKTLRLWDLATGKCLRTLEGHSVGVNAVALAADGADADAALNALVALLAGEDVAGPRA